jgi:hypothetical protein
MHGLDNLKILDFKVKSTIYTAQFFGKSKSNGTHDPLQVMNVYKGAEVQLCTFQTSAPHGDK